MLRQTGISPTVLDDPEAQIPALPAVDLLEMSAARAKCDSFGLLMAERHSFTSLGPLSLLLERVPTVRDTVKALVDYQRHISNVITIALEEQGGMMLIRFEMVPTCAKPQAIDNLVASGYLSVRAACGGHWAPLAVHLVRKAPANLSAFQRFYPFPIKFNAKFNGLMCTPASLATRNPLANDAMAAHVRSLLELVSLETGNETISDHVRRSITLLLPSGQASLANVANRLGLSVRTLQRSLELDGNSFADLLNAARRELTQRYLIDLDHSVARVSELVGYCSTSAFNRWFFAEFGTSPQKWRAAGRMTA
ncbi:MAG TPA: AraC family transcriptional regulator ligand-binding domain-containing protein [Novosphingobium sp.]